MIEISEKLFEHGPDFSMVIDASYYPVWNERLQKIPQQVAEAKAEDQEGSHRTLDERIQFIGNDAAVLTRFYRYTFTETGGKRGHHDSAVTILFMRKTGTWRIVHYHGSHGARIYD